MSLDLTTLTIKKAHDMLMSGETTAPALAKAYLDVIAAKNPDIHAYLEVYDNVMIQAEFAQKRIDAKENVAMLTGIPLAIKDNITVKGHKASAASKILENYVAPYDATVITKLQRGCGA